MPLFGEALKLLRLTSQPATPAANTSAMYFKSDGLPYYLGPDGIEHPFITVPSSLHLNASFDAISGGKPTNWTDFYFTAPGVVSSDTTDVVSGAAVKLGNLGSGTDSGFYAENGTHAINDQQSISFTVWAKTDIFAVSNPILEITHITAVAQADAAILNPNAINTSANAALNSSYTRYTFTFAVPPGHLYGRFAVRIKWGGTQTGKAVWLDESTSSADQAPPTGVPVGAGAPWFTATPPANWLIIDGSSKLIADWPVLSAILRPIYGGVDATHFNLPPGTNRFLVGAGSDAAIGTTGGQKNMPQHSHNAQTAPSGGVDGTLATNTTGSTHNHPYDRSNASGSAGTTLGAGTTTVNAPAATGAYNPTNAGAHTHGVQGKTATEGSGTTADENRPPFLAVNWIIRAA